MSVAPPLKRQRNSNLEILRIISMLGIVVFHLSTNAFGETNFVISNPNNYFIYFFGILGEIAVDAFVLISSYFMVNSKLNIKKLFILGGEVYFYSIVLFLVFLFIIPPAEPITIKTLISTFLPLGQGVYWFITDYIILMILSPFLNKFIKKISKKTHIKIIVLFLILWSIYPNFSDHSFGYSPMGMFILLYLIGGYIRLHLDINKINYKKILLLFIISMIIIYAGANIIGYINILYDIGHTALDDNFANVYNFFAMENDIFVVLASATLFLLFLKRKEFSNKYINYISGSVFGVYIIHDNVFVRPLLWKSSLLNLPSHYYSPNLILIIVFSTIITFITCIGIDIVRRETIEKVWIWILNKKLDSTLKWISNKIYLLLNKFNQYIKE